MPDLSKHQYAFLCDARWDRDTYAVHQTRRSVERLGLVAWKQGKRYGLTYAGALAFNADPRTEEWDKVEIRMHGAAGYSTK